MREVVDFSALLEQLTQRFEDSRIAEEAAQREQLAAGKGGAVGSRYELYVQRMRRVRGWYEQKLRGVLHGEEGGVGLRSQDREEDGDVSNDCMQSGFRDDFLTGSMLDDMEDAYWHDFLGEWGSF